MTRIMACGNDDTTIRATHAHSNLCGRCSSQAYIYNIIAHTHKSTAYNIFNHFTRDTCVTSDNNLIAIRLGATAYECSVCRSKLHNVERIKCITRQSANRSADTRN